ncbi:antibiotic ABC transporter ATP-binding protein, partial [Staphylococcus equorum]
IELICDRAVFLRDGHFVQDVNMTEGQTSDQTILHVESNDFDKALTYLKSNFEVIQSYKESGEIILHVQTSYQPVLKGLATENIFPNYIETRRASLRDTYFNINQRGDK